MKRKTKQEDRGEIAIYKSGKKGVILEAHLQAANIDTKLILLDGEEIAELMIDHDVGVAPVAAYEVKRLDSDYFSEE